jgi:hypothetical protein
MKAKNVLPIFALLFLAIPANAQKSYQTDFPLTQNPISENGNWISGHAAGNGCFTSPQFCWGDVQTASGLAFATVQSSSCNGNLGDNCNDSTAVLSGSWGPVQTAQATIHTNGAIPVGCCDEVELRLRTTISTDSITGYEINCNVSGLNYMGLVRWNGPLGNFTGIKGVETGCVNGDVLKATVDQNNLFSVYKNGVLMFTATDGTFVGGSPGIGFFDSYYTNFSSFGFSSFSASATTGSSNPPPPPPPSTTLEITSSDNSTLTRIADFLKRLGCQGSRDIWTCK